MRQAVFVLRDICSVEFAPVPGRMARQEKRCGLVRLFQGRKCTRSCDNSPKWKQCNHGNGSFLRSRLEQNVQASILNHVRQELRGRKQNADSSAGSIRSSCEAARSGRDHDSPNSDVCSGTAGLLRRLLLASDAGRRPNIKTELLSMASATRARGSDCKPITTLGSSAADTSWFE